MIHFYFNFLLQEVDQDEDLPTKFTGLTEVGKSLFMGQHIRYDNTYPSDFLFSKHFEILTLP